MGDNRELYICNCVCGNFFYAAKSIFQNWGMLDCGHASCPECKVFYNLEVQEETKSMKLTPWHEHKRTKVPVDPSKNPTD